MIGSCETLLYMRIATPGIEPEVASKIDRYVD
jgi:hypothetical protein